MKITPGNEVTSMLNKRNIREFVSITIGTIIVAAAVYFFMYPSHVTVGSAAGLALVISEFVPMPASMITMIMNVGLLIIGFILIGPEFGAKTVYCAVLLPASIGVFEWLFPDFQSLTGDPLIDVVCYITLVGVGSSWSCVCVCREFLVLCVCREFLVVCVCVGSSWS